MKLENIQYLRYDSYKDSGIEWLGEVPVHWDIKRLKNCLRETPQYGANEESTESNPEWIRFVRITDITENGKLRNDTFASLPPDIAKPYMLKKGDILLARSGATVGKAFKYQESWGECCFAGYLIRFHLKERVLLTDFFGYFVHSDTYGCWIDSSFIQATIQNVSAQKYINLKIPVPSTTEQTTIADFLDDRITKIDRLIQNKETQIERLKELGQITITRAVTKGLNPDVPMKDSGIEWLGEIPAHWEVKRLKNICSVKLSGVDKKKQPDEYRVKLCNYLDVYNNSLITRNMAFMEATATMNEIKNYFLEEGDVIITKDSEDPNDIAVPVYVTEDLENVLCGYHLAIIRSNFNRVIGKYVFYCFEATGINDQFSCASNGITRFGISQNDISRALFMAPPPSEQTAITDFLDNKIAKIDRLIQNKENQIERFKEYRKIVIHNAVTGKWKVSSNYYEKQKGYPNIDEGQS